MAAFKDHVGAELVGRLGGDLAAAWPAFDLQGFTRRATAGLDELELMARVRHVADALTPTLPAAPHEADAVIRAALDEGGLDGWASMPVNAYVAATMLDRPDVGLPLLAALTPRMTAEFAIRPFIAQRPDETMPVLHQWTTHPDEHVRRLVSEGSRPRLPWGGQLRAFIADPTPALPLLDALFDDESRYVRLSVANHLNDISKDHPALAVETARRWAQASTHGDFVARHALRTLVKKGDAGALAVLGFDHDAPIELVGLAAEPATVPVGGTTTVTFTLRAASPARAAIDYVVHHHGARAARAGKVFKLATRDLPAGEHVGFSKQHTFAQRSVRAIHPGPHRIEVQVNGRVLGGTAVEVTD